MDDDRRHPVVPGFTFVNLCESTVERKNLQRSKAANDSTSLGLKNIGEERWVILKSEVVRPGSLCMSDRIRSFIASPTKPCKQYSMYQKPCNGGDRSDGFSSSFRCEQ